MLGGSSPSGKKEEAATAYSELEKESVDIGNVKERLGEVVRALGKLENGTYGLCDCCGKPIPPARLEALPQTTYCIDCKVRMSRSPNTASSFERYLSVNATLKRGGETWLKD